MRIIATNCPNCDANITLVVDRYDRCEGQCGGCGRLVMTSLPRVKLRHPGINDCRMCGGKPMATTFVDHCKRRYCAITCLTCGTTLASSKGDVVDKWNVMTMKRRITPAEFLDRVKKDLSEGGEE